MIKELLIKKLRLPELIPILILSAIPLRWYNPPGLTPNPKFQNNEFEIVLEYTPQRLFEFGAVVAILTFVGCIGCFGLGLIRRKK